METRIDVTAAVKSRYSDAAKNKEVSLCCPVEYNKEYLKIIPQQVLERDYGCGDPSAFLKPGETVLDLGSGGGKICFIAAQIVGEKGRVIGVDMNDDMLALARGAAPQVSKTLGFNNVTFAKGRIEDLTLNRDLLDSYLKEHPVKSEMDFQEVERQIEALRRERPLVANDSMDVVVSNCVLNLVSPQAKRTLFNEIFRVLKRGGRAVISDIVCDEVVPAHLVNDPELWSGCLSGAFQESDFLKAFEEAGFYGVHMVKRDEKPWQIVEGIEFRSVTVIAYKGKQGACWEHNEALIYKGPFQSVTDDDGHVYRRGERMAVCRKTFEIYSKEPYAEFFYPVEPLKPVSAEEAKPFPCDVQFPLRHPKETKGEDYRETKACEPGGSCC